MTVKKQKKLSGHTFRALFKRRAVKAKRPGECVIDIFCVDMYGVSYNAGCNYTHIHCLCDISI